jgi:glycogen debranching enzyme
VPGDIDPVHRAGVAAIEGVSLVDLVDGASFCVSRSTGDIEGGVDGLYIAGRRALSRWVLRIDGQALVGVDGHLDDPAAATFVARAEAPPGGAASTGSSGCVVVRRRVLGAGLRDEVEVRNVADEATYVEVELEVAADMADALDVYHRRGRAEPVEPRLADGAMVLTRGKGDHKVGCRVTASDDVTVGLGTLRWEGIVPARSSRAVSFVVTPVSGGDGGAPSGSQPRPASQGSESGERLERWHRGVPDIETDFHPLAQVLRRSAHDLGSLRLLDPEFPERAVVAAGAPWFLSLHGRDALLAAWMSMVVDPDLALGTLETLARFQGADVDDRTEEQPGRILHRLRVGPAGFGDGRAGPGAAISYGSVDATPLFVMLLGELRRWGLAPEVVDRLLPHADRALEWITTFGDRDGDGYVEYLRPTDRGERHQGWKDSPDPIRFPDGTVARGPIALAEVQAYTYAAFRARAHFAAEAGDDAGAAAWSERARSLQAAFNRDFWVDDHGLVAVALDGDKRPVPALTSNIGHCLWTGILDEPKAAAVAKHLVASDLFSGWGVRTLAWSMGGYDPVSLHTGAVWPHDNALCVAGLVRYGRVDDAHHIVLAQLEAAVSGSGADGRLGVLCGFDRDDVRAPVRYPDACTSRAWSAAAPLGYLRALLRLDPWVPKGKLSLAPALPAPIRRLHVARIPLLGSRVTVTVEGDQVEVDGLPPGIELVSEPRLPRSAEL